MTTCDRATNATYKVYIMILILVKVSYPFRDANIFCHYHHPDFIIIPSFFKYVYLARHALDLHVWPIINKELLLYNKSDGIDFT